MRASPLTLFRPHLGTLFKGGPWPPPARERSLRHCPPLCARLSSPADQSPGVRNRALFLPESANRGTSLIQRKPNPLSALKPYHHPSGCVGLAISTPSHMEILLARD